MDFSNRGSQPQPASPNAQFSTGGNAGGANKRAAKNKSSKWVRWGGAAAFVAVVVLVVAVVLAIGFGGPKTENSYVDTGKLQAVFLNTGQVYFGTIKSLNSKYLVLDDIYYLQTSSSNSNSNSSSNSSNANTSVSLVKLGCELHAPYDRMVINRDQVTFWENLQSTGQVAKAVSTFQKDNPNGQKCTDQSQAGSSTGNGVQGSGSNSSNNSTGGSSSSNSSTNSSSNSSNSNQ